MVKDGHLTSMSYTRNCREFAKFCSLGKDVVVSKDKFMLFVGKEEEKEKEKKCVGVHPSCHEIRSGMEINPCECKLAHRQNEKRLMYKGSVERKIQQ